jgi:HEAT repeat protein
MNCRRISRRAACLSWLVVGGLTAAPLAVAQSEGPDDDCGGMNHCGTQVPHDPTPSPLPHASPASRTTTPTFGGTTAGPHARRGRTSQGFDGWEEWWASHRDRFLDARGRRAITSGSSDLAGEGASSRRSQRAESSAILREALKDPSADARASAAIALGKMGDVDARGDLTRALAADDSRVGESAVLGLGLLRTTEAIPVLVHLLRDDPDGRRVIARAEVPPRTRALAALALGASGEGAAVDPLLAAVESRDETTNVRIAAISALGALRATTAVAPLVAIAQDGRADAVVRARAVSSLGKIGDAAEWPAIRRAVDDSAVEVSRAAVVALGRLAPADPERTRRLLGDVLAKSSDLQSRAWACIALGEAGGREARRTLVHVLEREQPLLRGYGAIGAAILGATSGDASVAVAIRDALATEDDSSVRGALCVALGILEAHAAEADLVAVLRDAKSPELRGYAALALGMMGARTAQPAIEAALAGALGVHAGLERSAATALGLLGDAGAVTLVTRLAGSAASESAVAASAVLLGCVGDERAIAPLLGLSTHSADRVRSAALSSLGTILDGGPRSSVAAAVAPVRDGAPIDSLSALISLF